MKMCFQARGFVEVGHVCLRYAEVFFFLGGGVDFLFKNRCGFVRNLLKKVISLCITDESVDSSVVKLK